MENLGQMWCEFLGDFGTILGGFGVFGSTWGCLELLRGWQQLLELGMGGKNRNLGKIGGFEGIWAKKLGNNGGNLIRNGVKTWEFRKNWGKLESLGEMGKIGGIWGKKMGENG